MRAVPPIHILVENCNVTLEVVVRNKGHKNFAGLRVEK